jgi:hypothetical protein
MPEWYLAILALGFLSVAGVFWEPLLLALPVLVGAVAALLIDAGLGAARARFPNRHGRVRRRLLTALLYLLQPLARLEGRIANGLTPWRRRGPRASGLPVRREHSFWSERWRGTEDRIWAIANALSAEGSVIRSGGDWDRWDLQVRGGLLGGARLIAAIEEHGGGRQLVRVRSWPHAARPAVVFGIALAALAGFAALSRAEAVAGALGALAVLLVVRVLYECGAATAMIKHALHRPEKAERGSETTPQVADTAEAGQPLGMAID